MKYRLLIVWLSLKWVFRINLGDAVWYLGQQYVVSNGVNCGEWRLDPMPPLSEDGWVPRFECHKVWSASNLVGSFRRAHQFYMAFWFDIWKREGIKPWMKGSNIW